MVMCKVYKRNIHDHEPLQKKDKDPVNLNVLLSVYTFA
jgi:hypothetical protein